MPRRPTSARMLLLVWIALAATSGCCAPRSAQGPRGPADPQASLLPWENDGILFPDRLDRGYTLILCGAMGLSNNRGGIAKGLQKADVPTAIELCNWTRSHINLVENLRDLEENRAVARIAARKIVFYQERYPGRPVYLVGYSGGGGVAVFTLEALPPGHAVTRAILLAPTVSADYDLRPALGATRLGIHNFYSTLDVPILVVLGTAVGTTEGRHALAGGAVGFLPPAELNLEQREAYRARIAQTPYDLDMIFSLNHGGHFGWVAEPFIVDYVAPLISEEPEEAPPAAVTAARNTPGKAGRR